MHSLIPAWVDGTLTPVEKLPVHQRGLRHMAQRAEKLGAQLTLAPAPGSGLRVRLHLPLLAWDLPVSGPVPLGG